MKQAELDDDYLYFFDEQLELESEEESGEQDDYCPYCLGSGEGQYEGTRCSACKGKGE